MTPHPKKIFFVALIFALLIPPQVSNALIVRDETTGRNLGAPFSSVGALRRGDSRFCTGTLISSNRVLTAWHCVDRFSGFSQDRLNRERFAVSFRVNGLAGSFGDRSSFPITRIRRVSSRVDLAVLTLDRRVPSSMATPVRLSRLVPGVVGSKGILVGFGCASPLPFTTGRRADVLRRAGRVNIDSFSFSRYPRNISRIGRGDEALNVTATRAPSGAISCPADSGGPLFTQIGGRMALVGVISRGSLTDNLTNATAVGPEGRILRGLGARFL